MTSRRTDVIWGAVSAALATVVFVSAARLDPEPYHDGSQLPPAIAVSEGLVIHKDVFTHYSFPTAWMHALVIEMFGPTLISIRLFTALLLVVSTVLLFVLARWALGSPVIAAGVALLWVVTWPGQAVMWGTPLLPWPSVVFLVLQLLAVLLTARALLRPDRRNLTLAIAGAAVALAALTRLNYGVPLALALIIVLAMVGRRCGITWTNVLSGVGAGLVTTILLVVVLVQQGAWGPFLDQSIIGPLSGYGIVAPTPWFYLENAYLWGSLLLFVTLMALWWLGGRAWLSAGLYAGIAVATVLGLTLWASSAIEASPIRQLILSRLTWAPALDGQAMQPLFLAAIMTVDLAGVVIVVWISTRLRRISRELTDQQVLFVLLALTGVASLAQLYPVADPNHLWWAAPITLVLALLALNFGVSQRTKRATAAAFILPGLILAPITAIVYFGKPRTEITTGTLAGMWIESARMPSVLEVDRMLADVEPRSADFDCQEGLFVVWNGTYLGSSPSYHNYDFLLESASPGTSAKQFFYCVQIGDEAAAVRYAAEHGLEIVGRTTDLHLSTFSNIVMFEMKPRQDG